GAILADATQDLAARLLQLPNANPFQRYSMGPQRGLVISRKRRVPRAELGGDPMWLFFHIARRMYHADLSQARRPGLRFPGLIGDQGCGGSGMALWIQLARAFFHAVVSRHRRADRPAFAHWARANTHP